MNKNKILNVYTSRLEAYLELAKLTRKLISEDVDSEVSVHLSSWTVHTSDSVVYFHAITDLEDAHRYGGIEFKDVVFHPHADAFSKDVVNFLKTRIR